MRLALEALEKRGELHPKVIAAATALRQALEQPEQPQFFYGQDPNVLTTHDKGAVNE